jgi:hypothetical protein
MKRRRIIGPIAVALIVAATQAQTATAQPASLKLFGQLKSKVDRQGYKIQAGSIMLGELEGRLDWNDACTANVIDLGLMLDYYVAPLHSGWEPLAGKGLYALAVAPECVEASAPAEKRASEAHPLDGLLRSVKR